MKYYVKFNWRGEKLESYPEADFPYESTQGFVLLGEEEFNLYNTGNYLYGDNGRPVSIPSRPLSLEEQKPLRNKKFKEQRNRLEKSPVPCKGYFFDYDDDSRDRINEAIGFMERNNVPEMNWVLADNASTEVTVSDLYAVKDSAAIRSGVLHEQYNRLKVQINAATTQEQLDAIEWKFDEGINYT